MMMIEGFGGRTRARTWDPVIKSHLLYQLSYAPAHQTLNCDTGAVGRCLTNEARHIQQSRTWRAPETTRFFGVVN